MFKVWNLPDEFVAKREQMWHKSCGQSPEKLLGFCGSLVYRSLAQVPKYPTLHPNAVRIEGAQNSIECPYWKGL